jgi:type II secretory pathway component GspD/PulD (secretin)
MQSEVLVPDGGTTVMGGVLTDNEGESQQRTPGLASIPVVGNLFKRKLTTRQNSEILFFITPHIYRPDYMGRPISGSISTGPRTTTIPQPVPLGNPPSNTPTSTQLQEDRNRPQTTPGTQPTLNPAPIQNLSSGTNTARPGTLGGQRP